MARDFTKNLANYIDLPTASFAPKVSGAAAVSLAAWVYPRTVTGTGSDNRILNAVLNGSLTTGFMIGLFNSAGAAKVRCGGRSQAADSFLSGTGATTVPFNQWSHVGGVLDFPGDTIRTYLNGSQDSTSAVAFGASALAVGTPTAADAIGAATSPPAATTEQTDGYIAEIAIYDGDIGSIGFYQLAKGFVPLIVNPSRLRVYFPLLGRASPERDIVGGLTGNLTGSVPAARHPRVYRG